ncbi:MAG: methyl-viologen-reducing hydrogenase subunit delta, partial [SAR324 cluster bacterium]|nr:methyl-viologen-reducing hydrogenase subunit delta [SAR324 cluster bacterium]
KVVEDEMITCARCEAPYINRRALEAIESKVLGLESLLDTFAGKRKKILRMCPDCRAVAAMWDVDQGNWEP